MYGSAGGDLGFVIYAKHTRTWVNSLGAEWRNEVQLGYDNLFKTSFYQPLDVGQRWFVEPQGRGFAHSRGPLPGRRAHRDL